MLVGNSRQQLRWLWRLFLRQQLPVSPRQQRQDIHTQVKAEVVKIHIKNTTYLMLLFVDKTIQIFMHEQIIYFTLLHLKNIHWQKRLCTLLQNALFPEQGNKARGRHSIWRYAST